MTEGSVQMTRIVRTAEPASRLGRDVYTSVETAIPITARLLRPIVILPADLISLDAPDLAAIISHERAHIRRNDLLGNFAARVVEWGVRAYGHASDVQMVKSSGSQTIDFAAAEAAAHSTYKPARRNCRPVNGGKFLFKVQLSP